MPIILATPAIEGSTYAITASFTDSIGASVAPNAGLNWTLYKKVAGVETIIRGPITIAPATSITIVLSGADLALVAGESKTRYILFEGTFNSSLGLDLPIRDEVRFSVINIVST